MIILHLANATSAIEELLLLIHQAIQILRTHLPQSLLEVQTMPLPPIPIHVTFGHLPPRLPSQSHKSVIIFAKHFCSLTNVCFDNLDAFDTTKCSYHYSDHHCDFRFGDALDVEGEFEEMYLFDQPS